MSYTCRQEIIVIEDSETCNRAFDNYILGPALQFIGLDCEWNTNRPVSLLQIATPTIVLLVRVCKLNFTLPENVKLVLEDPTICKVGVNIEYDSEKLGEDCFCKIKSWVDLRHVAIRSISWGRCIVEQVENLEYSLKFYDQKDPNSESAKQANTKRICWCPKMGLESLISDCMDKTLPKNTSARWSDDWESDRLQSNQKTYAANDATASLDIFVALVYSSVSGNPLPFDLTFDVAELIEKYSKNLENAVKGLFDVAFTQTKDDMERIYRMIEATDPELDIKAYYTKQPSTKSSQKEKNERKEFYKKKAREAAAQKSAPPKNTASAQPTPVVLPTESEPLPTDNASDPSQDLDSSRGSHTFREITQALAHTKPNSKTLTENFLTMQSDRDKTSAEDIQSKNFPHLPILFYFKHITDKKAPLIPGYSYGRGSIPPANYRRFRTADSETQTESEFKETNFKKVFPSYKPVIISELERNSYANTDYSSIFRQPPVNKPLISADRTESPLPNSTTDDDQGSESSCTSSNYQSSVSKNSKSKGRGRGRGKPVSSIGSSRNVDSDSNLNLKRARGRGRGAVISETRAPNSRADADSETEKVVFNSYDIRYQNADEGDNRPTALNLEDRSRRPTTSSVSSAATIRSDQFHLPASAPASLTTPSTDSQVTSLPPSPASTRTLRGVLFLTDSVLKHTPESFISNVCGSGLRCTKKINYRLTQVFGYDSDFAHFDYVIIACGVNDLARYDDTPQSLADSVIPRLGVTCSKYNTTIFLYSSILETKHGWLNKWIDEFNWAMFEVAAKVPNLFFFDAHSVLEKDPIISDPNNDGNVFRPGDDVHITDTARRVVTNELALGIRLLLNLNLERFDQARTQLQSWDWPLRPCFLERRRSFMKEFYGAIPSF